MFSKLDFITSVIHSCESSEQIEIAMNWAISVSDSDTEKILKIAQEAQTNLHLDNLIERVENIDYRLESLEVLAMASEMVKNLEESESE